MGRKQRFEDMREVAHIASLSANVIHTAKKYPLRHSDGIREVMKRGKFKDSQYLEISEIYKAVAEGEGFKEVPMT